jgi:hypothetical protein
MKKLFFSLLLLFLACYTLWFTRPVHAADAVVGDGTPGSCTEAALDDALVTVGSGGGTLTFNCGPAAHTIPLTNQKVLLPADITINGGDLITLDGTDQTRHFFAGLGITLRLQNITLQNGWSGTSGGAIEASGAHVYLNNVRFTANTSFVNGGAIYCYPDADGFMVIENSIFSQNDSQVSGGAIYNDACPMTIRQSSFTGNNSGDGGAIFNATSGNIHLHSSTLSQNTAGHGGAIENSAAFTITNSLIADNTVTGSGGGIWNMGGRLNVTQTTISHNTAYEGGGLNSYGNEVILDEVNVVNNTADGLHGGGIFIGSGTLFGENITISGNRALGDSSDGGGLYHNSTDNISLTNLTLVYNTAGRFGGGLYHYNRYAVLINATIGYNTAGAAGDAIYEDSPMTAGEPGVVQLANSVIFGSANNCDGPAFESLGHNISTGTCTALSQPSDQENYGGDLLLGSFTFNAGSYAMKTILPQTGSPLINAGDPAVCLPLDQRGGARVGNCDIGAVEFGSALPWLYLPLLNR